MAKFRIVHEVEADNDGAARRMAGLATDALWHNVGPAALVAVQRDQAYFSDLRPCERCQQLACGGECPAEVPKLHSERVVSELRGSLVKP